MTTQRGVQVSSKLDFKLSIDDCPMQQRPLICTQKKKSQTIDFGAVWVRMYGDVFRNIHAASGLGVERAKSYPRREFSRSLPHGDWPKSPLERAEPTHTPATCVCIAIGEKGEGPPRRDHPHFLCCYMTDL